MATKTKAKSKKKTEIIHLGLLLDESGSMAPNVEAVVGGVGDFTRKLREGIEADKEVRATLAMFDQAAGEDLCRIKYESIPLDEVSDLRAGDYSPRGMTPLNDAVVTTINSMDKRVGKGEKAMLVIFTDGYENASETSTEDVRKAIEKKEKQGWTFIYLGANQDAWAEGQKRGVAQASSMTFASTPQGTRSAMGTSSNAATLYANTDKATYETAMKGMSSATGGNLQEDEVLDPADYLKQKKEPTEGEKAAEKALRETE